MSMFLILTTTTKTSVISCFNCFSLRRKHFSAPQFYDFLYFPVRVLSLFKFHVVKSHCYGELKSKRIFPDLFETVIDTGNTSHQIRNRPLIVIYICEIGKKERGRQQPFLSFKDEFSKEGIKLHLKGVLLLSCAV